MVVGGGGAAGDMDSLLNVGGEVSGVDEICE